jgi:hypothetical protein
MLTVDFVVYTLAVKKKSGQVSTCRIGPFPCQTQPSVQNAANETQKFEKQPERERERTVRTMRD